LDRDQIPGIPLGYSLRPCRTPQELAKCHEIQRRIWGYADHELYPLRLFVNLSRVGGHVLGAFTTEDELVGFVAAMPAWHGKRRYLHSLALGVLRGHENRGLGRALKLAQRDQALAEGIGLIEWTFDPLRAKNANLNINRLGVIVRRYEPDCYGRVESRLQQGLPSDRLISEWWIRSRRVAQAVRGGLAPGSRKNVADEIEIPSAIEDWIKDDPAKARKCQARVRDRFLQSFARKLTVTGFTLDRTSGYYLLESREN